METISSRIELGVTDSISYDENRYAKPPSFPAKYWMIKKYKKSCISWLQLLNFFDIW